MMVRHSTFPFALVLLSVLLLVQGSASLSETAVREGHGGPVIIAEMRGPITPVTLDYTLMTLDRARRVGAGLVVFEMDTPGGLVSSTEEIIRAFLASPVPIAVYVSPSGAQAASAGLYITNAADIAAMAPGTRIGAGHPVTASGGNPGGEDKEGSRNIIGEKIENDMAAGVRSIATQRGRNAEVYEQMVRQSISKTEREALEENVIDIVATSLEELLEDIQGRDLIRFDGQKQVLSFDPSALERAEMNLRQRILSWIAHPQISALLLLVGLLGLYVEFNNPGLIAPAIVGAVCLLAFAMSVQLLPVNFFGIVLILLAVTLFILELNFTSYGFLSIAGVVSLTLGCLTLFDFEDMPSMKMSLAFVLPTSLTIGLIMAFVTFMALRAQRAKVTTGSEGLIGETGETVTEIDPRGKIFVHGEYWNARSSAPIPRGVRVRILAVRNMEVDIERIEE